MASASTMTTEPDWGALIVLLSCPFRSRANVSRKSALSRKHIMVQAGSLFAYSGGEHLPSANPLSDRAGIHLPHHVAAMQLYGDFADAEVERDLFVHTPVGHFPQHLTLPRSESFEPLQVPPHD